MPGKVTAQKEQTYALFQVFVTCDPAWNALTTNTCRVGPLSRSIFSAACDCAFSHGPADRGRVHLKARFSATEKLNADRARGVAGVADAALAKQPPVRRSSRKGFVGDGNERVQA